jgi:LuxR family transcriptional regulator, maltose regulon positive regulatory protein
VKGRTTGVASIRGTGTPRPGVRGGLVPRPRLVQALAHARDARLLLIDAPVGYGKSTVLALWLTEEEGRRSFVWLTLDASDSDPGRLVARLVESLRHSVTGFGADLEPTLGIPESSPVEAVVPRLLDELATVPEGFVIVLDDYHLLRGRRVHDLMKGVVEGLPSTVQIAVATRSDPPLPLGRLRASGAMVELRAKDLQFDEKEAGALLTSSGVTLEGTDLARLVERCEGWPAGIYLAALSLRSESDPPRFVGRFAGTNRHIADYLTEEVLRRQPRATRTFLLRTSVLDRMCGPLCDSLLDTEGSQSVLERLEHSNLFVVALDDERKWYRYHHLFGEMLRAGLARSEPTFVPTLHRKASDWFEASAEYGDAVGHALAAGDRSRAARLISRHWLSLFNAGRLETVRRWLEELGDEGVAALPAAALTAGWVAGLVGRPEEMERWLRVAELGPEDGELPDGTASLESGVSIVRGLLGYEGLEARRRLLTRGMELEPDTSPWRPFLLWGLGHVALLSGDAATAKGRLDDALRQTPSQQPILAIITLSELALAEAELGHVDEATALAHRAEGMVEEYGLTSDSRSSGVSLAVGVTLVARGDVGAGHEALEQALLLRRTGRLSPWPTLEVLVALAPVRFLVGDVAGAKELLAEARAILAELPDAGDLVRRVEESERQIQRSERQAIFGETLTDREMSIMSLMPSDQSLREIGGELYLSLNTVKTHTRAIYRKLGVSSRKQAVERARELDIL